MEKQTWLDLIPFYLNGTLNSGERQVFEQTLRQNPDWQQHIEEWRTIADAVYMNAHKQSKGLPPMSPRLLEAIQTPPGSAPNIPPPPTQQSIRALPPRRAPRRQPNQRLTNAIGTLITAAAAVAILIVAGILFMAVNTPEDNPTEIAFGASEVAVTTTDSSAFAAPNNPTNTVVPTSTPVPPTAILPAASTPIPVITATSPPALPTQQLPNGGGGGAPDTPLPTPHEQSSGGSGDAANAGIAESQIMPEATTLSDGRCYIQLPLDSQPIPIYQLADTNADVIGLMQPGQRFDTRINAPASDDSTFYQVFLPNGATRLGWVDSTQVNLVNADGSTNCNNLILPTPTNPALPGGLPTPITDSSTCRVAGATGSTVAISRIPEDSSGTIAILNLGDLFIAREYFTGGTGWYRVIVPGVGFGWVPGTAVVTNGNCDALPRMDTYEAPTQPAPITNSTHTQTPTTPAPSPTPETLVTEDAP